MRKKILLSAVLSLTLLCQSTNSFAWEWPVVDSTKPYHDKVIQKFIANAKNQRTDFQYIGHLFKIRGGTYDYVSKNNELYLKADILNNAFQNGKRIQIKPTSSEEVYSNFKKNCLYKIIVDGNIIVSGFVVYNAENDIVQPPQVNHNNNAHNIVPQNNNNNNAAPQQSPRVNQNVNIANIPNPFERMNPESVLKIKNIVQGFQQAGQLSAATNIVKIEKGRGAEAKQLIYATDGQQKLVIKVMNSRGSFEAAKKGKTDELNFINNLNQMASNNNLVIPKIIVGQELIQVGNDYAELQILAKGKPIGTIDIHDMSDNDVKAMFKAIGTQMGNLDRLLIANHMPLLEHPDGHPHNFFYDKGTKEFSWIDVAGVSHPNNDQAAQMGDGSLFSQKVIDRLINRVFIPNGEGLDWVSNKDVFISEYDQDYYTDLFNHITLQKISTIKKEIRNGSTEPKDIIESILKLIPKFSLAVKSLGEGYVLSYPEGKNYYNKNVKYGQLYNYLQNANEFRKMIGKPEKPIFDLLVR
ncbi:MAG: hypothetical protein Q8S31_03545 [Alphaproteobacteria bacterium]|nr:hypothetical protein [Alphaproteobacteria bacterium]